MYQYLSINVDGIRGWPIHFQFWFSILGDLPHEGHRRPNILAFSACAVVHFKESYAKWAQTRYVVIFNSVQPENGLECPRVPFSRINADGPLLLETFTIFGKILVELFFVLVVVVVVFAGLKIFEIDNNWFGKIVDFLMDQFAPFIELLFATRFRSFATLVQI